jgi:nitrogen regulatory protein P-II 1
MKLIIAVIRPEQLPAVKQALFDAEIRHMTASAAMGSAPRTEQQLYRGVTKEVSLFNRVRLDIAVTESNVDRAVEAIRAGAQVTGGSGKIFVVSLDDTIEVSGKRGTRALY